MKSSDLEFYKMSGAGNDFIIFDGFSAETTAALALAPKDRAKFAASICRRGLGVGADGVVFLERSTRADFQWDFYNSDGSSAEMCGNASRCVSSLAFQLGYVQTKMSFLTRAGVIFSEFLPDRSVRVVMSSPSFAIEPQDPLTTLGPISGYVVNSGVPHFVIERNSIDDREEMGVIAKELRWHKAFGPAGSNVTFWTRAKQEHLSVSYERGVEGFTLACGTGAVAAGMVIAKKSGADLAKQEIEINVPGGRLWVGIDFESGRPTLRGPAAIVYIGNLNLGAIDEKV